MAKSGTAEPKDAGDRLRALKAVASGKTAVGAGATHDALVLRDAKGAATAVPRAALERLARDGLLARAAGKLALTSDGEAHLARAQAGDTPYLDQHRDIDMRPVHAPEGRAVARVNLAESPLAQLARRRHRDGAAFLSHAEFVAGERLRTDYTSGQIMPRMSANWETPIATGPRSAPSTDISNAALAARLRVERALDAVGPELSGVLVDLCCFLKGLETIEAERGWPARSAKIVLKTALGVLARHYDPGPAARRPRPAILGWGSPDYRPRLGG